MKKFLLLIVAVGSLTTLSMAKSYTKGNNTGEIIRLESPKVMSPKEVNSLNLNFTSILDKFTKMKFGNKSYKIAKIERLYDNKESYLINITVTNEIGETTNMLYFKNVSVVNNKLQLTQHTQMKYYCSGPSCCTTNVTMNSDGTISYTCGCNDCVGVQEM